MALDRRFAFLLWLAKRTGHAFDPRASVEAMRTAFFETNVRFGFRDPGGITTRELTIPAGDGATLDGRLYRSSDAAGETLPVLLYFHGGGWVIGDMAGYDGFMRYIAHHGRMAVVAIDYRLGPEHRFPRGHEDAFDAFAWLQQHAARLGLDPARIAVGGDSAGGGLSAAIASYANARALARPAFAFLIYPAVDATGRFASRNQYAGNLPLTPATMEWFMKYATSGPHDATDPRFVPLDAPNPEQHPPTYVLAAQYDPLVDEGRAYFERLRDAGARVAYDLRPTLPHAFVNFARVIPEAKRALDAGIEATAVALGARPARVAVVTGAASGIGRALAQALAKRNYILALADRNEAGLEETARLVRERTTASVYVLDVADRLAVEAFAAFVLEKHGRIDVVINNAGVALSGSVSELSVDEMQWLVNINFWGTVYGVKAFLPALQRAPDASIVNVSSAFGLVGLPGQAAYAASKFAVRGLSESLREELRGKVHVMTVYPGGVKTNIARTSRIATAAEQAEHHRRIAEFERVTLHLPPEKAAEVIVRGIERKSDCVLIGRDALRIDALTRILGFRAARFIAKGSARRMQAAANSAAAESGRPGHAAATSPITSGAEPATIR
jgi:acetyl esterase/lipase/short-subunit dehydrogenase